MTILEPDAGRHPTPFTVRQLECFVAVAEHGSITRAAASLRASDSAVSDAVSAMERVLGVALIVRRRSLGAELTSEGHAALPIALRMLADADDFVASVGNDPAAMSGPVRLGASVTLAGVFVPSMIAALSEYAPRLSLDFVVGDQPAMIRALEEGGIDAAVVFDIDLPPELSRHELTTTSACLVVHEGHRLADREAVELREVADDDMVLLDIAPSRMHTLEIMSAAGVTPRIGYRTSDYELCRSLVGRGLGYTLLMRRAIRRQTWDGRDLISLTIAPAPRTVSLLIVWIGRPSARVTSLIRAVRAHQHLLGI